jgi:hypothetical protein
MILRDSFVASDENCCPLQFSFLESPSPPPCLLKKCRRKAHSGFATISLHSKLANPVFSHDTLLLGHQLTKAVFEVSGRRWEQPREQERRSPHSVFFASISAPPSPSKQDPAPGQEPMKTGSNQWQGSEWLQTLLLKILPG